MIDVGVDHAVKDHASYALRGTMSAEAPDGSEFEEYFGKHFERHSLRLVLRAGRHRNSLLTSQEPRIVPYDNPR